MGQPVHASGGGHDVDLIDRKGRIVSVIVERRGLRKLVQPAVHGPVATLQMPHKKLFAFAGVGLTENLTAS